MKRSWIHIKSEKQIHNQNRLSGILFGIGLIAFVDEAVFHQLLHWHHFYDLSTTTIGLISDGLFHALSWFATVAGLFIFADLRRQGILNLLTWNGGILFGIGVFQLYDGVIQHKLMKLHQIRYVDNVIYYDIVWNVIAVALIVIGIVLLKKGKQQHESFR